MARGKKFTDELKYRPVSDWGAMTGARTSRRRINKLVQFQFNDEKDLSNDDLFATHAEMFKRIFYAFAIAGEELWGEEKALQLFDRMGYNMGMRGWQLVQQRFNSDKVAPAQIAWYQDMAHLLYGPGTHAYGHYDAMNCICTREKCLFKPPEGLEDKAKYCEIFDRAYIRGYMDVQPGLVCTVDPFEAPDKLPIEVGVKNFRTYEGGTICQHIWRYGTEKERKAAREMPMTGRSSEELAPVPASTNNDQKLTDELDYKPVDDWGLRFGSRVSRERIDQLVKFQFNNYNDLSSDDIFATHAEMFKRIFYAFAVAGEQLWGEQPSLQLFDRMGYNMGMRGWKLVQKRFNTDKVAPAQIAWYQDYAHLFYGPGTHAYGHYDDQKCICTREKCLFKPPDGLEDKAKYCETFDRAYLRGYMDVQPGLVCTIDPFEHPNKLPIDVGAKKFPTYQGGTICQHIWRYGTEEEQKAAREVPLSGRRSDGKPRKK